MVTVAVIPPSAIAPGSGVCSTTMSVHGCRRAHKTIGAATIQKSAAAKRWLGQRAYRPVSESAAAHALAFLRGHRSPVKTSAR